MSKRAEEAALKAYPKISTVPKMVNVEDGTIYDANASKRKYFIQGYEQAEKDTIERAARWIMKSENQAKARFRITDDEFIELFRKAMEEE